MPNWCYNRYELEGNLGDLIIFKNWLDGLGPIPGYHLACYQLKKFVILGWAGYLVPAVWEGPVPINDHLVRHPWRNPTYANWAYTDILHILSDIQSGLTPELCRKINTLYHQADLHLLEFNDMSFDEQELAAQVMNIQGYDWYPDQFWRADNAPPLSCDDLFDREFQTPDAEVLAGDLCAIIPPTAHAKTVGYNGRIAIDDGGALLRPGQRTRHQYFLTGVLPSTETEYDMNCRLFGNKWPRFQNDLWKMEGENKAVLNTDSAWAEYNPEVAVALRERFNLEHITHEFMEEQLIEAGRIQVGVHGVYGEVTAPVTAIIEEYHDDEETTILSPDFAARLYKERYQ